MRYFIVHEGLGGLPGARVVGMPPPLALLGTLGRHSNQGALFPSLSKEFYPKASALPPAPLATS